MQKNILVVDDDPTIGDLIQEVLEQAGYGVQRAYSGTEALLVLEHRRPDLVLLDLMLPGASGYELMDYIRPMDIPVIFLTAKTSVADRVKGLRLGADDYLGKPFEIIELLARVESVLRRYHKTEEVLEAGDLVIDVVSRVVKKNGEVVNLTKKEFDLLVMFVQNRNIALFREKIYEHVWESEYTGDSRTVDLHVQRLRRKVGWEDKIKPVYKVGYRLEL